MAKAINLTGKRFGRLVVLIRNPKNGNRHQVRWDCVCDCGNKHTVTGESLRDEKSKSCGCLLKESRKSKVDRTEALLRNLYSHIKTRYKKRYGTEGIISFELFCELSMSNCHYCGVEPGHLINDYRHDHNTKGRHKKVSDTILLYNGLDRIDSDLGYVNGNIVPCCKRCNIAKLNYTYDDFNEWVIKVYNHLLLHRRSKPNKAPFSSAGSNQRTRRN